MASIIYPKFHELNAGADIDLDNGTFKVALVMTGIATNITGTTGTAISNVTYIGDLTGTKTMKEYDGTATYRQTLTGNTLTIDTANTRVKFDGGDVTFSSLPNGTSPIKGAMLYENAGADASANLVAYIEFASTVNPGGGDLVVQWDTNGIMYIANA